ncbi:MAG: Ig-like domain-containing protein [Candidatus Sulfotelmatobacter sp.]
MSSTKHKLRLAGAFAALTALALAVSCTGFFTNPTYTTLSISPSAPTVQVGANVTLQAYGIDNTGNGSYLTTGVSWSSATPTVGQISGSCASGTCGAVTIQGVSAGTSTITAATEAVTATATLTVLLGSVTDFEVCEGTFGDTSSCSTAGGTLTSSVPIGQSASFIAQGTSNGTVYDLTVASTWTPSSAASSVIECLNNGASPETCTVEEGAVSGTTYPVTVTYGSNIVATLNITAQ